MDVKYRLNAYDGDSFPSEDIKLLNDATTQLNKAERFIMTNSDPILITIAVAKAVQQWQVRDL